MKVYMDNGATTRVTEPVMAAMLPYFCEVYGNPSSAHGWGREARRAIETARAQVARAVGAEPSEIYFTSGGTEAVNWALRGAAHANRSRGRHIVTAAIEHHAALHACQRLEREGFEVTYLLPDADGVITPEALMAALRPDTILASVMAANNEIGTLQPIEALAKAAKARGALFHTDAMQAVGHVPVDVKALGVDLLSLSGHKFHAPKGVGALYVRRGVALERLAEGGAQERGQRPGTENVAGIVGLGKAAELAAEGLEANAAAVRALRDHMIRRILSEIPGARLNGHPDRRLCGNVNVCFPGADARAVLFNLDLAGVAASAGSSCASGSAEPSHVLLAVGLSPELAQSSIRLTLGEENTLEEADYAADTLKAIVERLRGRR